MKYDVAIVGGGPSGSSMGILLKKYRPDLSVAIFEQCAFPRDHVGESQLPAIMPILSEMGVWDKVEAAGFPIKLGGVYRWGATDELWNLNFIDPTTYEETSRPALLTVQRMKTAFHVDRSIYDKILLDHAECVGCEVFSETRVTQVDAVSGKIDGISVQSSAGSTNSVSAQYFVDATGTARILAKALNIGRDIPPALRNVAFWDYWNNTEWAELFGSDATRIQVLSLGWGWMWFIPLSSTRTSIGLVVPADHFKQSQKRPLDLYLDAIHSDEILGRLVEKAMREGKFETTSDWNFISHTLAGENWFLVGDCCGFADPILSAGMTLAHTSSRKAAYSILELIKGDLPPEWIREQYSNSHSQDIKRHIRFAEFWYAGNGKFSDLKRYCTEIAKSSGLKLTADEAFAWLGRGGFATEFPGAPRAATFPLNGIKHMTEQIVGETIASVLMGKNIVRLLTEGSETTSFGIYQDGQVIPIACISRGDARLPVINTFGLILNFLQKPISIDELIALCKVEAKSKGFFLDRKESRVATQILMESLEAMVLDGWVEAQYNPKFPASRYTIEAPKVSLR